MALEAELITLIDIGKSQPESKYVLAADLGGQDCVLCETTLGPHVDTAPKKDALLHQITSRLSDLGLSPAEIDTVEPFLVEHFDAAADMEAELDENNVVEGGICLIDEAAWIMLQAQNYPATPIDGGDQEIQFKGRSLRRSAAD